MILTVTRSIEEGIVEGGGITFTQNSRYSF